MPTPRVIDLSHHNSIPEDLFETKEAGIVAVIHKLTEGSSHVDSKVQARHYLTQQAGLKWGLYHFMRPGDMKYQAEFFFNTAHAQGIIDNDTLLVADHEDQSVSGEQLKEFLDHIEDLSGRSPVVYSGHVIKEQLEGTGYRPKRRLWLCHYSSTPVLPEGVDKYWLWQYTDQGVIPGVTPPTDLNHFDVPVDEFLASWSGSYETEPVPPEPEQEYATITISSDVPVYLKIVAGENVNLKENDHEDVA